MGPLFLTLLNAKSPKLDPNIAEGLEQRPINTTLRIQLTVQELTGATHSIGNGKTIGPVEVFVAP